MGVIPWGFESPLRHQVGRPGNGVRNYRTEDRDTNGDCGRTPFPGRSALRAELPKCGESRTETPEQEGLGSGDPAPSRSWLGNRNSLAREVRCGEFRFLVSFCERGASPPFTLSPRSRGQRTQGSLPLFFSFGDSQPAGRTAGKGTPISGRHRPPQAGGREGPRVRRGFASRPAPRRSASSERRPGTRLSLRSAQWCRPPPGELAGGRRSLACASLRMGAWGRDLHHPAPPAERGRNQGVQLSGSPPASAYNNYDRRSVPG